MNLRDKVAIVTGASREIGAAMAEGPRTPAKPGTPHYAPSGLCLLDDAAIVVSDPARLPAALANASRAPSW